MSKQEKHIKIYYKKSVKSSIYPIKGFCAEKFKTV